MVTDPDRGEPLSDEPQPSFFASLDPSWHEPAAIVLLVFGGVLAGVGWLAGVFLLWTSKRWTPGDKVAGTLLPFTGILPALYFLGQSAQSSNDLTMLPFALAFVALAFGPVATAAYLTLRLRETRA